jgi:hypothetical protein
MTGKVSVVIEQDEHGYYAWWCRSMAGTLYPRIVKQVLEAIGENQLPG